MTSYTVAFGIERHSRMKVVDTGATTHGHDFSAVAHACCSRLPCVATCCLHEIMHLATLCAKRCQQELWVFGGDSLKLVPANGCQGD